MWHGDVIESDLETKTNCSHISSVIRELGCNINVDLQIKYVSDVKSSQFHFRIMLKINPPGGPLDLSHQVEMQSTFREYSSVCYTQWQVGREASVGGEPKTGD